jgi:hypothetical protein
VGCIWLGGESLGGSGYGNPLTPIATTELVQCSETTSLFDHLVGERKQLGRNVEAERLGGLEIDD